MNEKQINFINKIAPMAKADWEKNHIVIPSITISQAIQESGWATSILAVKANNLFGIKATKDWTGPTFDKASGEYTPGGAGYVKVSTFRVYDTWAGGIEDHSKFLSRPHYAGVIGQTDFCLAAHALKMGGYATGPYYSQHIAKNILDYKLYKYDPIQPNWDNIYRVQTNCFKEQKNAEAEVAKLAMLGYKACMIKDEKTGLIFVQVGAYRARDKVLEVACNLILQGYRPMVKIKQ